MPSPFPGMNPYFEQAGVWHGFHMRLIVALQDQLSALVLPYYFVGIEEALFVKTTERGELIAVADVAVKRRKRPYPATAPPPTTVATAPMTTLLARAERVALPRKRWLTIRDQRKERIITVIELLSPSNKTPGRDRERYLRKRTKILYSTAHLVEIDLLRGGERPPLDKNPNCDYCVTISRQFERPRVDLWPLGLRDPLPTIPIPLIPGAAEPRLDLKAALDTAFDRPGYQYRLYQRAPNPPLSRADAVWAKKIIRQAEGRP